jgi:hypothetical protein
LTGKANGSMHEGPMPLDHGGKWQPQNPKAGYDIPFQERGKQALSINKYMGMVGISNTFVQRMKCAGAFLGTTFAGQVVIRVPGIERGVFLG